jgi:hypothetical protein
MHVFKDSLIVVIKLYTKVDFMQLYSSCFTLYVQILHISQKYVKAQFYDIALEVYTKS